MNLILKFRERVSVLSYALVQELEQLLGVIRQTFRAEHNDDGTHTDVTAMSVTTESVAAETLVAAQNVTAGASASAGLVRLVRGTAVNTGYVEFSTPAGVRQGYIGWGASGLNVYLENSADLVVQDGAVRLVEMVAPSNGPANTGRLFCRDNGAGKTQLCVIFGSGAIQVVATEP